MFEDSFLINVLIFGAGQVAAYGYLRTGLRYRGLTLMTICWVLADVALIEVLAFDRKSVLYLVALVAMQVYSMSEFLLFVIGRIRRGLESRKTRRDQLLRDAFLHYLRDEIMEAEQIYRRLRRTDPWDLQATLGLATVSRKLGQLRKARGLFRAARNLDLRGEYADLIKDELQRFGTGRQQNKPVRPRTKVNRSGTKEGKPKRREPKKRQPVKPSR